MTNARDSALPPRPTGPGLSNIDPLLGRQVHQVIELIGRTAWANRIEALRSCISQSARYGKLLMQRHIVELTVEKCRRGAVLSDVETRIIKLVGGIAALHQSLPETGRVRLIETLQQAITGEALLVPLLHIMRTAGLQQSRGFDVRFAGLADGASFDLLITREGAEAEIACDTLSAEDGRFVNRGAWNRLLDGIDTELQTWLAAHPGRYLLKMTLPQGLRAEPDESGACKLLALQGRIKTMLASATRSDHDEAAVLRLDPLLLAGAQAEELGLMKQLRRQFGPEAQLAVTESQSGTLVLAARAGADDEVAGAMRRRLAAIAPARLSGTRPGILAMFIEDTDRVEWRALREHLLLEGEARQFLTFPEAKPVIAVSCVSRLELFGLTGPEVAPEGELRFRNPSHPAAKSPGLAPAVTSSM